MDKNNEIKEQFGREASKYTTSKIHSKQDDLDFVLELIKPQSEWDIADIATGTGHLAMALSPMVNSVQAIDITQGMLEEAEKEIEKRGIKNISTKLMDVHEMEYPDNYFDLTCSRIAPHHFHDIDTAIVEMVRITKSRGSIFIQDTISPEDANASIFFNKIEKLRDRSHVKDLSPSEWKSKFEINNCRLIRFDMKPKNWQLKRWTERMSTPRQRVVEITEMLENEYSKHGKHLDFIKNNDGWLLRPNNGYFLFNKN